MSRERVTIKKIAEAANVSSGTVSMILRGTQGVSFSRETRQRVLDTADRLGYIRQPANTSFHRPTIAVFLPLVTGCYYTFMTQAITQEANTVGMDTVLFETHRNTQRELRLMQSLGSLGVSGVVFTAPPGDLDAAIELSRTLPTVIVHNRRDNISTDVVSFDTILIDDFRVGELVASHLLELGHRNVVFVEIGRQWQGISKSQRRIGAQACFDKYPDAHLHVISRPAPDTLRPGSFIETRSLAHEITEEGLAIPDVTAFICISDYTAYGVMDVLAARGFRIPQDYSVCACDDLFASSLAGVSLTTADRHPVEIGANSFTLLHNRIQSQKSGVRLPPRVTQIEYLSNLRIRNSSATPRQL